MYHFAPALILSLILAGCTTTKPNKVKIEQQRNACPFIQRNLTVNWEQRTYWCIPSKHS